jgi:hypothetical protein
MAVVRSEDLRKRAVGHQWMGPPVLVALVRRGTPTVGRTKQPGLPGGY